MNGNANKPKRKRLYRPPTEYRREYNRNWRKANPAKCREYSLRRKDYSRKYNLDNRAKLRAKLQRWRAANREKVRSWDRNNRIKSTKRREYERRWEKDNHERLLARRRERYPIMREKRRVQQRRWTANNPDKVSKKYKKWYEKRGTTYHARRRALKRSVTIGDLTAIAVVYERARELRQWFDVAVDHIIPIARGGTHEAPNLQIIYGFENRAKSANLNYKPRVIFR